MGTQFKVLGYDLRIFIMLSHVTFHISSAVMTMSLLFGLVMGALPPRPRKWTVGEIIRIKVNPFAASEYPRFEAAGRIKYHDECDGKVTAVSIKSQFSKGLSSRFRGTGKVTVQYQLNDKDEEETLDIGNNRLVKVYQNSKSKMLTPETADEITNRIRHLEVQRAQIIERLRSTGGSVNYEKCLLALKSIDERLSDLRQLMPSAEEIMNKLRHFEVQKAQIIEQLQKTGGSINYEKYIQELKSIDERMSALKQLMA